MKWIKLNKYLEDSGDTADAVHARRKTGKWLDGIHCQLRDGKLWVNTEAVDTWMEQGLLKSHKA